MGFKRLGGRGIGIVFLGNVCSFFRGISIGFFSSKIVGELEGKKGEV